MFKLNIDKNLKLRINNLYSSLWKAQSEGRNTTEHKRRILKLEKRYIEQALGINLTEKEIKGLNAIVNVKSVFPGSKVVGMGTKSIFPTLYKQTKIKTSSLNTNPNNGKGGDTDMGITIEAEELIEAGVYEARIANVSSIDGKYGPRLQVSFELKDCCYVNGFFAPKATPNNKTGELFEKALGELRTADSDELIGKTVKVLIEHVQRDGRVYCNVSKIL